MVSKKSMGEGLVVGSNKHLKHRTVKVNLSSRQVSNLKNGGSITIKAITDDGTHELELPEIDIKKLMTKLNKGVGARISLNGGAIFKTAVHDEKEAREKGNQVQDRLMKLDEVSRQLRGGSVESMFRDLGKYVQPLSDAAIDRGRRELGSGMRRKRGGDIFRDLGKYVQPLSDAAIDRGRRELGSGMRRKRGGGPFDFLDPNKNGATKFFTTDLPSSLIHDAIPIAGSTIGGIGGTALTGGPLGGMAGAYAGQKAGEQLANEIGRQTGRGLSDVAFSIAKAVGKKVAKKVISHAAQKAKHFANQVIDRGESMANEYVGDGIYPAGVSGSGIIPAGVNLRRGGAIDDIPIQTGSPYISHSSPAFHPFRPTYNPFTSNNAVQRQPKSGGMIVRM